MGGQVKLYPPHEKHMGEGRTSFIRAEKGITKRSEVIFMGHLSFRHVEGGVQKVYTPLTGGGGVDVVLMRGTFMSAIPNGGGGREFPTI